MSTNGQPLLMVRWEQHNRTLLSHLGRLLTDGAFLDVTLQCSGHLFRAHRVLLSACSPYFERLLLEQTRREASTLVLHGIVAEDVCRLLQLMYTGGAEVPVADLPRFLGAAATLDIRSLQSVDIRVSATNQESTCDTQNVAVTSEQTQVSTFTSSETTLQSTSTNTHGQNECCQGALCRGTCSSRQGNTTIERKTTLQPLLSCEGALQVSIPNLWTAADIPPSSTSSSHFTAQHSQIPGTTVSHSYLKINHLQTSESPQQTPMATVVSLTSSDFRLSELPSTSGAPRAESCMLECIQQPLQIPNPLLSLPAATHPYGERPVTISKILPATSHPTTSQHQGNGQLIEKDTNNSRPTAAETLGTLLEPNAPAAEIAEFVPQQQDSNNKAGPSSSKAAAASIRKQQRQNYVCAVCGKSFGAKSSLKAHERLHSGEKPYLCVQCGKSYKHQRNYKYHMSAHAGTQEFAAECAECGKVLRDRGYLRSHMKIHRNAKEYVCAECGRRFNQRPSYNLHMRIHTGEKPHRCAVCDKAFSRKSLLREHIRVHTGEKPFECQVCGRRFSNRSNMKMHSLSHFGNKPFECAECAQTFSKVNHLRVHQLQHGEKQQQSSKPSRDTSVIIKLTPVSVTEA